MDLTLFTNKIINEYNNNLIEGIDDAKLKDFITSYQELPDDFSIKNYLKSTLQSYAGHEDIVSNGFSLNEFLNFIKYALEKDQSYEKEIKDLILSIKFILKNKDFYTKSKKFGETSISLTNLKHDAQNAEMGGYENFKDFFNKEAEETDNKKKLFSETNNSAKINRENTKIHSIELMLNTLTDINLNDDLKTTISKKTPDEIIDLAKKYEPSKAENNAVEKAFEKTQAETQINKNDEAAETAKNALSGKPLSQKEQETVNNNTLGGGYNTGAHKSNIFGVAVPTLSSITGNEDSYLENLNQFIENFEEAFNKKIKDYSKPLIGNINTIRRDKKQNENKKNPEINFKAEEPEVNESVRIFKKVINERLIDEGFVNGLKKLKKGAGDFFSEFGAIGGNLNSIGRLYERKKKELTDNKDKLLDKLKSEIQNLGKKYHTSLKGNKRLRIAYDMRDCYLNFVSSVEKEYREFTKYMDPYISDMKRRGSKAKNKISQRESENKGLSGQLKAEDLKRAENYLLNIKGENITEKLTMVALYSTVSKYAGSGAKVSDLNKIFYKGGAIKFVDPTGAENIEIDKNKFKGFGFENAAGYDLSNCKPENITNIPVTLLRNEYDADTVKFICSNPEIFNKIFDNENFKKAYKEFMSGYDIKPQPRNDISIPGQGQGQGQGLAGSVLVSANYLDGQLSNIENPSFKDLGMISKIVSLDGFKTVLINIKDEKYSGLYFLPENKWKDISSKELNQEIKGKEADSKVSGDAKAKYDAIEPGLGDKYLNLFPSDRKKIDKKYNENPNNKEEIKNTVNRCLQSKDRVVEVRKKLNLNSAKELELKLKDMGKSANRETAESAKKVLDFFACKTNESAETIVNLLSNYFKNSTTNNSAGNAAVNTEENDTSVEDILDILKSIISKGNNAQATKQPVQSQQSQNATQQSNTNNQPTQQPNTQTNQSVNSTVTTSAADATYGNGYAKGRKIREIIYKKGDYTVKTREEL